MGTKVLCLWSFRWAVRLKEHILPECRRRGLSVSVYVIENSKAAPPASLDPARPKSPQSSLKQKQYNLTATDMFRQDAIAKTGWFAFHTTHHLAKIMIVQASGRRSQQKRNRLRYQDQFGVHPVTLLRNCSPPIQQPADPFAWRHSVLPCNTNQPQWILGNKTHKPFQESLLLSTKHICCLSPLKMRGGRHIVPRLVIRCSSNQIMA